MAVAQFALHAEDLYHILGEGNGAAFFIFRGARLQANDPLQKIHLGPLQP